MAQKLSEKEAELYKRVDEVLHYIWDPIGIANSPSARNEYESYLPQVFSLVIQNKDTQEVVDHLTKITSDEMGINLSIDKNESVARILMQWKNKLFSK